jgi:hypothetical protein
MERQQIGFQGAKYKRKVPTSSRHALGVAAATTSPNKKLETSHEHSAEHTCDAQRPKTPFGFFYSF